MSATTAWVGTCPRQPHVKTVSTKEKMNKGPSGKCCIFSHEVNARFDVQQEGLVIAMRVTNDATS